MYSTELEPIAARAFSVLNRVGNLDTIHGNRYIITVDGWYAREVFAHGDAAAIVAAGYNVPEIVIA